MRQHPFVITLAGCLCFAFAACKPADSDKAADSGKAVSQNPQDQQQSQQPLPDINSTAASPGVSPEQTLEGELRHVDLDTMTFEVKDASGAQRKFSFSPATKITGIPNVQGLTGKQGSRVKVGYTVQGDTNSAAWVEIGVKPRDPGL